MTCTVFNIGGTLLVLTCTLLSDRTTTSESFNIIEFYPAGV